MNPYTKEQVRFILNNYIKKYKIKSLLVEPIKINYEKLKENYKKLKTQRQS